MVQIIMTVETSSCETNVGEVRAILDGGNCRIDWGDGTDLSKCDKLEKLELTSILEGFRIKLPTHCLLKEFIYDESFEYWFPKRTLNKIARIVKQNGGKILRTTRTERLLRKSENNGQM